MNAKFHATTPEEIEFSLTLTMTLRQWRMLLEDVTSDAMPSLELRCAIGDMVRQANKVYYTPPPTV